MPNSGASKARLVITAITLEKRTVAEVVADYGVSRSWVYELLARYRAEGEDAFEPRSRRPQTSPHATPTATVELILRLRKQLREAGLDAGAETIELAPDPPPPDHRVPGHDPPDPDQGRCGDPGAVQATEVVLPPVRGSDAQRDLAVRLHPLPAHQRRRPARPGRRDHHLARRPLPLRPARLARTDRSPHEPSWRPFDRPLTCTDTPHPRSPTTAWSTPSDSPATAEEVARTPSKPSSGDSTSSRRTPGHPRPTTCGKVESFQQTMKKWLRAQPDQPTTLAQLQAMLDAFVDEYNHRRPHRSLPHRATPATTYNARPKATPSGDRSTDSHDRTRHDIVSTAGNVTLRIAGQLRHIGIGRTYARTRVILLVQDLHVRIVDAATGELLRELIVDPSKDYQPTEHPEMTNTRTYFRRSGCPRCPETSHL